MKILIFLVLFILNLQAFSLEDFYTNSSLLSKFFISLAVLVFFISIRKLVSILLYFVFIRLLYKKEHIKIRLHFLKNINKPLGLLLLFYGLHLNVMLVYPQILSKINTVFYISYVCLITWIIFKILDEYIIIFLAKLAKKMKNKKLINLITKILYIVIILVACIISLILLGFDVSTLIASLGLGGLALALAAKDIIANLFASIMLLFDDSFNQADSIEVLNIKGTVVEIGLRKTTIRTSDNCLVFLPNSSILSASIKNLSKRKMGLYTSFCLSLAYSADLEKLKNCMKELNDLLSNSKLIANSSDLKHQKDSLNQLVSINDLQGYKSGFNINLELNQNSIDIELSFYTKTINSQENKKAKFELLLQAMEIVKNNKLEFINSTLA